MPTRPRFPRRRLIRFHRAVSPQSLHRLEPRTVRRALFQLWCREAESPGAGLNATEPGVSVWNELGRQLSAPISSGMRRKVAISPGKAHCGRSDLSQSPMIARERVLSRRTRWRRRSKRSMSQVSVLRARRRAHRHHRRLGERRHYYVGGESSRRARPVLEPTDVDAIGNARIWTDSIGKARSLHSPTHPRVGGFWPRRYAQTDGNEGGRRVMIVAPRQGLAGSAQPHLDRGRLRI